MRFLPTRPLPTPVKFLGVSLLLVTGTIGVAASAAHADPNAPGGPNGPVGVITKPYAMFHCASQSCTAGSYGNNFYNDTEFIANEAHTLSVTCKIRSSGPTSYLGTVDGWTGTWRVSAVDLTLPDEGAWAASLPDC